MFFLFIILIIVIIYKNNKEPFSMYDLKKESEECYNKMDSYIRSNNFYYCISKNECKNCKNEIDVKGNKNINITESDDCIIYPGLNNLYITYKNNNNIKFSNKSFQRCGNIKSIIVNPKNY